MISYFCNCVKIYTDTHLNIVVANNQTPYNTIKVEANMTAKTIEDLTLLENYFLALNFPGSGIVPFRVLAREQIVWDPYVIEYSSTESVFEADGWKDSSKIGHPTDTTVDSIFELTNSNHLMQLFCGIQHADVRAYLTYPEGKTRRNLDVKSVSRKADFGFVDGSMSPYNDPQPVSEVWIPKSLDIGYSWYNRASVEQDVIVKWIINLYDVEILKNVDMVEKILNRRVECRIATLGGVDSFRYNVEGVFGVNPIPFGAGKDAISEALRV